MLSSAGWSRWLSITLGTHTHTHDIRTWDAIPGGGNNMGLGGDRNLGFHGHPGILGTLSSAGWSRQGCNSLLFPVPSRPPKKIQEKGNPGTVFSRDNMYVTVFDMFVAGTESTSITLRYCLMLLLEHPEVAGGGHSHGCSGGGTDPPTTTTDLPSSNAFLREGAAGD